MNNQETKFTDIPMYNHLGYIGTLREILDKEEATSSEIAPIQPQCPKGAGTSPSEIVLKQSLDDRMKELENNPPLTFNHENLITMRLDGHCFRTYTRSFKRPFDNRIADGMISAAKSLVSTFNCASAYVFSDEITLIFPILRREETVPYNGRMVKLCTLASSLCAAKFNSFMYSSATYTTEETKLMQYVWDGNAFFDARMVVMPDKEDVRLNVVWRNRSCMKNSKMTWARQYFSEKELKNVSSNDAVDMAEKKQEKKFTDLHHKFRCGVLIKKMKEKRLIYTELPSATLSRSKTAPPKEKKSIECIRKVVVQADYDKVADYFKRLVAPPHTPLIANTLQSMFTEFLLKRDIQLDDELSLRALFTEQMVEVCYPEIRY